MKANRGLSHRLRRVERQIAEQHERIHEFHRELYRAAGDRSRVRAREVFGAYRSAIKAHFDLEERVLYPSIVSVDSDAKEQIGKLCVAHRRFLDDLGQLAEQLESSIEEFGGRFESYKSLLTVHERQEEALVAALARMPVA